MPTEARTTWPGDVVYGEEGTSDNIARLPGGWVGDAYVDADQLGITTAVTDLTGLTTTFVIPAERKLEVTAKIQIAGDPVDLDQVLLFLMEGGDILQRAQFSCAGLTGTVRNTMHIKHTVRGPTAGSHTYKLALQAIGAGSTVDMEADPTYPAELLVMDIGQMIS